MSYNELRARGTADFPVELYYVDRLDSRYEMVSHWHTEYEIIRVISGKLNVRLNNNTYTAGAGDILFVNPETIHSAVPDDCVYECVDFDINFLSVASEGCRYFFEGLTNGEYKLREYFTADESEVHTCVNGLFELLTHKSTGYKFRVIGALYEIFGVMIDNRFYSHIGGVEKMGADKNTAKLKTVLSYMRANFDKPITLTDMADAAEMSPKYFCGFFKQMTRKSPIEYLNTYRIEQASKMLLNSGKSVTETAFACGFNDLSYFIKTFKTHKNTTPARFRKGE